MLVPGRDDVLDRLRRRILAQIEADDLGAERLRQWFYRERSGFQHGVPEPPVFVSSSLARMPQRAFGLRARARGPGTVLEAFYRSRSGLKLQFGKARIKAASSNQLLMLSLFDDAARVHHHDAVT